MASLATKMRQLARLRSTIFDTSYNPSSARTGAKYIRRRLLGPAMVRYYPQKIDMKLVKALAWDMDLLDPAEEERREDREMERRRGKGAPKKLKTKSEDGQKNKKKKKK
ncbi:hypothetical protein DACRYDRAFT_62542 [Dacryopinax primogenitus]|uniref:Small ribosomal subunit protein mS33 n=1 Tax=Dacryopinax primogenitus (strain DJM 731) TaxID=1858805 RepID=M5GBP9_DACPD|nr:uncharacterized protein DACRYDRAFT_62542 [Dacryopinax primogenitus]EJU05850.1 hypothetical protein DACRYDRAFT_62542 [Dacryopinax primogenitus]